MVGGLIALVVVLAAASAVGFAVRKRQGRFRPAGPSPAGTPFAGGTQSSPEGTQSSPEGTQSSDGTGAADTVPPSSPGSGLSAADLGAPLGARATLVQFSTEVCAYCGPTRELLTEVARERDGVAFVEIDAAARMDLTKRLHVMSTPTVLVLDAVGGITSRASGPVRKADLVTAVCQVLRPTGGTS